MSTSWTMNIFLYYDDDGARDGTWDHIEARRNLEMNAKPKESNTMKRSGPSQKKECKIKEIKEKCENPRSARVG